MDLQLLRDKQLVERWIAGKLTPPETRFFEDLVRKRPEIADALGLPDALKRMMRLLDDTGTEWQERPPRFWHNPLVPILIGLGALCAIGAAGFFAVGWQKTQAKYDTLRAESFKGVLVEPISTQTTLVQLAKPGEPGLATYKIGSRKSPTFAELRPDVHLLAGHLYSARIERDDGTFWARADNLLRDSNGELRIALNSGALAAGNYMLEVRQTNLRGDGEVVGRARLSVSSGD